MVEHESCRTYRSNNSTGGRHASARSPATPCRFAHAHTALSSRPKMITDGVGCKAVIDGIGKATLDMSLGSLAQRGIFVSFGNASGAVPAYPPLRHIAKSSFMCRPKLLDYTRNREELLYRSNEIMGWLQSGQLKVSVDTSFPLDQAAEGHKYLESGASTGKVLYRID